MYVKHFERFIFLAALLPLKGLALQMNLEAVRSTMAQYTIDCGHWYAGGSIGLSHLHDDRNPGSTNSVDQTGPGANVVIGYQWNAIFGIEGGFTSYYNSRETSGNLIIARTKHYSAQLATTLRYPLGYKVSALGKLGAAYNYAQKTAEVSGFSRSAEAGSVYYGVGLVYSVRPNYDLIAQFAEAYGNHLTGSADLWSVGLNIALV